jgi:hypothetical protein
MPVKFALTCAQCDAPLPAITQRSGAFTCRHCGATTAFALDANEFALFTDGLRAEQQHDGAFHLSGVSQALSEQMAALTAQVERSVRLTERLHLPQLETELRSRRATLEATTREYEETLAQIAARQTKERGNRNRWFWIAGIATVLILLADSPGLMVFPVVAALWAWLHARGPLQKLEAMERELRAAVVPELNDMRAGIAEQERLIDEIRHRGIS